MKLARTVVALALVSGAAAQDQDPAPAPFAAEGARARAVPATADAAAAKAGIDRAIEFLVTTQNPDGSWASGAIEGLLDTGYAVSSFFDWQLGAHALALMALAECDETPARRAALDRGVRWFCDARRPRRGNDWDNDTIWAALYGVVAAVKMLDDQRFEGETRVALERRGREMLAILVANQVLTGGWGYYDDPPYSRRPKWGTSFSTALVVPTLARTEELGWLADVRVRQRAIEYVRRCALPNGAYEYDLNPIPRAPTGDHINQVKGSLGRIQVCNWALSRSGDPSMTASKIRRGLERLLEHHRFLDVARMRPIPHEAYYANAGYFYFFGHYYAALVINELPSEEREEWHSRLRPHVLKTQRENGSMCDFLGQRYLLVADTALGALTLAAGLPGRPSR